MSKRILTCSTKEFTDGAGSDPLTISGRCLLLYAWFIAGTQLVNVGREFVVDIKSGSASGSSLLKFPVVTTGYGQSSNRISVGTGGILFPEGIYLDPNVSTTDAIGGVTLLYELG